jgi:hypothetical protein
MDELADFVRWMREGVAYARRMGKEQPSRAAYWKGYREAMVDGIREARQR